MWRSIGERCSWGLYHLVAISTTFDKNHLYWHHGWRPFWEGFSLVLAKKYDLSKLKRVIVGGDGAPWVKERAELLGGIFELSKFHLKRALNQTLDRGLAQEVYQACIAGRTQEVDSLLIKAQEQAYGDEVKEIARLRGYLMENAFGLRTTGLR